MPQGEAKFFKDFIRQMGGDAQHEFQSGGEDYKVAIINNTTVATEDDLTPELADYTVVSGGTYADQAIANQDWDYGDGESYWEGDDIVFDQDASGPTDCYQAIVYQDDNPYPCLILIDLTPDGGVTPLSLQDGPIRLKWGGAALPGKIFKAYRAA